MSKGTNFFDGAAWFGQAMSWHNWGGHPKGPSTPGSGGSSSGGGSGPTATLTVTFQSEDAGYANAMGWYNARTGEAGILFKNTNDDGWNAGVKAGDSRSLTALQSDLDANNIGFFLIPNGANELSSSTLSSSMRFEVGQNGDGRVVIDRQWGHDVVLSGNEVLFSNQVYNKGDFDYVSGTVGTEGQTRQQKLGTQSDGPDGILGTMAWDDQAINGCGGTDRDFNDVVFTVTKSGGTNPPPNGAPTDISLTNASINENVAGGVIGTLSTADPNAGDTHTYSVSDSRFEVVNGELKLKSGVNLNYETEGSVQLDITSKDQGGLSYSESFTIQVKDVNEAPTDISITGLSVDENASGAVIGTLSTADPDAGNTHSYTVSDGRFEVVNGELKLKSGVSLDYETESSVQLKVTTTDQGGLGYSEDFTIQVKDLSESTNAAPTGIVLNGWMITENVVGAVVGTLTTTDPDVGDTHTYKVDDDRFEVVGNQLQLKSGVSLDFENGSSFAVNVTTTDQGGLSYSDSFSIFVKNVNEAPTDISITNLSVDENAAGAVIGNLSTVDPDKGNTHTYKVDDDRFEIVSGVLKLKSGVSLDYEAGSSVQLKITSTDQGGLSYSENFTVAVKDVSEGPTNSAPTDISLSNSNVAENAPGAAIGMLSTVDPNAGDTHTYAVNDSRFEVVAGQLKLKDGVSLNYETAASIVLSVTSTDQGGLSRTEDFTISVKDVSEAPGNIVLDNLTVNENDYEVLVGTLSTIDDDAGDTHTYTVDDGRFVIVGNQLLIGDSGFDYEIESSVTINISSTDSTGNSVTKAFTIEVKDVNEAPIAPIDNDPTANFVAANAAIGTTVGITGLAIDFDAGDSITYELSNDAGGLFAIDPVTGVVTVAGALDQDGATEHAITVRAIDSAGESSETEFTIQVGSATDFMAFGSSGADAFLLDLGVEAVTTLVGFNRANDLLSFSGVADTDSNGSIGLNDLLAMVSSVSDFGSGGDIVVDFTTGASVIFQGAGTPGGGVSSLSGVVSSPSTQFQFA